MGRGGEGMRYGLGLPVASDDDGWHLFRSGTARQLCRRRKFAISAC